MTKAISVLALGPEAQRQVRTQLARQSLGAAPKKEPRVKYHNRKTEVDGILFDSQREAERYMVLKVLADRGEIENLAPHPAYDLIVNNTFVGRYEADFEYVREGKLVVEDVKSKATKTPVYQLKKKLMRACRGVEIREIE